MHGEAAGGRFDDVDDADDNNDDDLMLRALVQLTESQNQRIEGLRRAVIDLQAQLQARRDVDVLLAHEVRTPLTVVTGVLGALEAGIDEATGRELIKRGLTQADHLAAVIDDLLEPPNTNGASMFPRALQREVTFADLVAQALDAVGTRHARTDFTATVTVEVQPHDLVVATAPSRAVAVLVNLLENAAKYAGGKPVEVTACINSERDLVVEVADRGPGLDAGVDPEQLFGAFARGTGHRTKTQPGRGVGLYLVRNLVRSLGGDVTLARRAGGGTVASFRLPQRRAEDPPARTPSARTTSLAGDASR
ncbi:MAG TPA: HAMP domain-containing sensor histidine kinase [Acidimicrobiales bacterium]|nr:HAMP domain-containing sensor histidine kinase [Acidimicrobiales bacterium]